MHNTDWLTHSTSRSPEGLALQKVAEAHGFQECVRKPTRGKYLLDLVLSDISSAITTSVVPGVSDHCIVLCHMNLEISKTVACSSHRFIYSKADWHGLVGELQATDWMPLFDGRSADDMALTLVQNVLNSAKRYIPFRSAPTRKPTHPWINDRCLRFVRLKCEAYGTGGYRNAQKVCSDVIMEAYAAHVARTKQKLRSIPGSSKKWWQVAKDLLLKSSVQSSIPPLLDTSGAWITDAKSKADTFASVWSTNMVLPTLTENEYTTILEMSPPPQMSGFLPIRARNVAATLRGLREDSGTGPDGLSARILKRCHSVLALPVAFLARTILREGRWPRCWTLHWLFPLHKRKAKSDAKNYRGIHLTPQISKVMERVVGKFFLPFMLATGAYGPNQFAYTPKRGLRDSLALNVLEWITALDSGKRIAVYLSDVSGAFDRVDANRLYAVLKSRGLHPQIVRVLSSWLEDRSSVVVVDGCYSDPQRLNNSVFQGTVWGPPLWNCFFESARHSVNSNGYRETVFADDLNSYKVFEGTASDKFMLDSMAACQKSLHRWGEANRVTFDAGKEYFKI